MNKSTESKPLQRLTGTLSPRWSAGYKPPLSNLSGDPPKKRKVPDLAATGSSTAITKGTELQAQPTDNGEAAQ
jgi:hypothetical protein